MTTLLMLIDAQRNMLEPPEPIPDAPGIRQRLESLLQRARAVGADVIHVQNDGGPDDPDAPGTTGWELVFAPLPSEDVVRKSVPNVFESNPNLARQLSERGVSRLVVAGMQSEWCIAASVRAAHQAGFEVALVHEAHATYDGSTDTADQVVRDVERALEQEGVTIISAVDVTFA